MHHWPQTFVLPVSEPSLQCHRLFPQLQLPVYFTCNNINAYISFTVVVVKFRNNFGFCFTADRTGVRLYALGFCRCFCCNLTFIPYMSCCRNFFFLCVSADCTSVNFYTCFGTGCFFFDCSVIPCMLCVFFMYIIVSCFSHCSVVIVSFPAPV